MITPFDMVEEELELLQRQASECTESSRLMLIAHSISILQKLRQRMEEEL